MLETVLFQWYTISRKLIRFESFKDPQRLHAGINLWSNFTFFTQVNNLKYQDLSNLKYSSYLTGLIEGDGSIITPKTERSVKGRINYPSIQMDFYLKDYYLALMIKKQKYKMDH
jgi:hypothetical protein